MNTTQTTTNIKTNRLNTYHKLATKKSIIKTVKALEENNFIPLFVASKEEALKKIKELIPNDASVMNGASATLNDIGYLDYLKTNEHGWNNLHDNILSEKDPAKQSALRKSSVVSDYYLGSAHALTENGELLIASNTGSQLPHLVFTSQNIILVVGAQKITTDLNEAFDRLNEHVIPLEDIRLKKVYGVGTTHAKTLILHKENPRMGRRIYVIVVNEKLGF